MGRWFWGLSAVLVVVLALVVVLLGSSMSSAHVSTGTVHLELDLVKDGAGANDWCNPVNSVAYIPLGAHQVAVCLSDVQTGKGPQSLQFDVLYDTDLNSCTDINGGNFALDDNPDFLQASLGGDPANWDCNMSNDASGQPRCDKDTASGADHGRASMLCQNSNDEPTLPIGAGTSAPIALVRFSADFEGVDQLSLAYVEMVDSQLLTFLSCYPTNSIGECFGATDAKSGEPVPTATNTSLPPTPTVTSTRCPNGLCPTSTPTRKPFTKTPTPEPTDTPAAEQPPSSEPPPVAPPTGGQQPVVTPPSTGTGTGGVDWTIMLTWLMGGGAALSLFAGGLYLRRSANR